MTFRRCPRVPAAFQVGIRRIEIDDVPMPSPRAGEVLVEMTAVGICGSDLHYFRTGQIGARALRFPHILGHEPAGLVAALGKGVRGLKVGQTVAIEPGISCGRCRACRQGRLNLCYNVRFLGSPGVAGAFQRFLAMPAACVKPVPKGVDPMLASAVEPLAVALHSAKLIGLRRGETVGIVGAGPIGLSALALARAMGARIVAVSDPRQARRTTALRLGAASAVEPVDFVEAVRGATGRLGAAAIFECSGAPEAFDAAVAAAERGARIALVGIPEANTVSVDAHAWRQRELEVVHVHRSNHAVLPVLRHLARSDLGLRRAGFFSETVGLDGLQTAFEQLDDDASASVKIVVDPRP
jgi:L-iditol 2-dehydrogenase